VKILVVEDDRISAKIVCTTLKKRNHEAVVARSGVEALEYLSKGGQVDLIVSDIMMPDMDGLQLLQKLKSDRRFRLIPVILTTALNDQDTVMKGLKLGAAGYIAKPIEPQMLADKVDEVGDKLPGAILVVDDEEVMLKVLTRILERQGHRVITASSGEKALEALRGNKISLLFSDIVMSPMSGLELASQVKKENPDLPVLLMTGQTTKHLKEEMLAARADGFIAKPFKNTEVLAEVDRLLRSTANVV